METNLLVAKECPDPNCRGNVYLCEFMGYWSVHCQDCNWKYGGSSLTTTKEAAITGWNSVPRIWV